MADISGPYDAGELEVDVVANLKGFRGRLEKQLKKAAKGLQVKVRTVLDDSDLPDQVRDAVANAQEHARVKVRVYVDRQQARDAIRDAVDEATAGDDAVRVGIETDRTLAKDVEKERAEAQAEADTLPLGIPLEPDRKMWRTRFREWFRLARRDAEASPVEVPVTPKLNLKGINPPIRTLVLAGLVSLLQPLVALLGSVGAGGVALVAGLSPAVGVVGALAGGLFSLAAAGGAGALAFNGFGKAVSAHLAILKKARDGTKVTEEDLRQLRLELRDLPPSMRDAALETAKLGNAFYDVRRNVQVAFFDRVRGKIAPLAEHTIPALNRGLTSMADRLGLTARNFLTFFGSKGFANDLTTIFRPATRLTRSFGLALVDITRAAVDFTVSSGPLLDRVSGWVTAFGSWVRDVAEVGRETGKTTRFLDRAADKAEQLGRIVADAFRGLFGIFRAGSDAGDDMLNRIERAFDRWADWVNSPEGQKAISDWIDKALPAFYQFVGLIGDIGKALGRLSVDSNLAGLIEAIRKDLLPPLEEFLSNLGRNVGPQVIELLSNIIQFVSHMSDAAGPVSKLFGALNNIFGAINNFLAENPTIATTLGTIVGSFLVLATTLGILNRLSFGKVAKGITGIAGAVGKLAGAVTGLGGGRGGETGPGGKGERVRQALGLRGQQVYWTRALPVYVTNWPAGFAGGGKDGKGQKGRRPTTVLSTDDIEARKKNGQSKRGRRGGAADDTAPLTVIDSLSDDDGKKRGRGRRRGVRGRVGGALRSGAGRLGGLLGGLGGLASRAGGGLGDRIGKVFGKASGLKSALGKSGALGKMGSFAGKALKGGGLVGAAAGVATGFLGGKISDGRKGLRDFAGGALKFGGTGAGIGATIGSVVPGIGTGIGAAVGGALGAVGGGINAIGGLDKIKSALSSAGDAMGPFVAKIRSGINQVKDFFTGLPGSALRPLGDLKNRLVGKGREFLDGLVRGARERLPSFNGLAKNLGPNAVKAASNLGRSLVGKGRELLTNLRRAAEDRVPGLISFVTGLPGRILRAAGRIAGILTKPGREVISNFTRGMRERITGITDALRRARDRITAWRLPSLYKSGKQLIQGLIDGVKAMFGPLGSIAKAAGQKIADAFPGSPVKVGPLRSWNRGGAGRRLVQMLVDGMEAGSPALQKVAASLAGSVAEAEALMPRPGRPVRALAARRSSDVAAAGRGGVVFEDGAIRVTNPAPEPASQSVASRMRAVTAFGLFE